MNTGKLLTNHPPPLPIKTIMISLHQFLQDHTATAPPTSGSTATAKIPDDLLSVTCSFVDTAMKELLPGQVCSAVVIAFEGVHSNRFVEVAAVMDDHGEMVSGFSQLLAWKPDDTISLASLLETAADLYLDNHLSPWDHSQPARGMLWIERHRDAKGGLHVVPRCVASFGSGVEGSAYFPA